MACKFSIYRDERGISLLELAITLPVLVTLIFGSLEVAMKVNSLQTVASAAQEGVKIAASYRGATQKAAFCALESSLTQACTVGNSIQNIPNPPLNFSSIARISSCNYLKQQKLDASRWNVITKVIKIRLSGKDFRVIELTLQEKASSCTVCISNAVSVIKANSTASMSIQDCQAT